MTRVRRMLALPCALLASLAMAQPSGAQEANPAHDLDALQKRLGGAQGKSPVPAKEGLKRRDLKGQAMSQQAEPEGLTPEQKKMYEDLQQQLQQIKENRAKSDAALEELMKGEAGR
ncbi:MAG: hypothetical protein FJ245_14920 [Nitrospira sp.]|nr:hypothetical protein [Nitrospira sp.]